MPLVLLIPVVFEWAKHKITETDGFPLGLYFTEFLIGWSHYFWRVKRNQKIMLSWPGYDKEEISAPLRLAGVDLKVITCQQDYLWHVVEGVEAPNGDPQISAIVVDQEQISRIVRPSGTWGIDLLITEMPNGKGFCPMPTSLGPSPDSASIGLNLLATDKLDKCPRPCFLKATALCERTILHPIGEPIRLFDTHRSEYARALPIRFGFNAICWEVDGFALNSNCEQVFGDRGADPSTLLTELCEAGYLGYYDWWFIQMLLWAKIISCGGDPTIDTLIDGLKFDASGQIEGHCTTEIKHAWERMRKNISLMKRGHQGEKDSRRLRAALGEAGRPPYVLLGPGDAFVGPQDKQFKWSFLGHAGGLLWVECLSFPFGGNGDACFTEEQKKIFVDLMISKSVQDAICSDPLMFANSPYYLDDKSGKCIRHVVSERISAFCPDNGTSIHNHSWLDCLQSLLADRSVILRPEVESMRSRHWPTAYMAID
jgi:hypothetical protein